jgi:hypothetical protein
MSHYSMVKWYLGWVWSQQIRQVESFGCVNTWVLVVKGDCLDLVGYRLSDIAKRIRGGAAKSSLEWSPNGSWRCQYSRLTSFSNVKLYDAIRGDPPQATDTCSPVLTELLRERNGKTQWAHSKRILAVSTPMQCCWDEVAIGARPARPTHRANLSTASY